MSDSKMLCRSDEHETTAHCSTVCFLRTTRGAERCLIAGQMSSSRNHLYLLSHISNQTDVLTDILKEYFYYVDGVFLQP